MKPKQTHQEIYLPTDKGDVTVRTLTQKDLPSLDEFFASNDEHLARGGLMGDALFESVVQELDKPTGGSRMGVFVSDRLVGYIGVTPHHKGGREVSYGIDKAFSRKGIALSALKAVTEYEHAQGNSVIAEVEHSNSASMKLLEKAGFHYDGYDGEEHREVYVSESGTMSEEEFYRRLGM